MKNARLLSVIVLALLIAIPVAAQEKQAKKKRPTIKISQVSQVMLRLHKLHKAMEELDLTPEQQEKLAELREENGPKMKEVFEKIGKIFTDEQKAAAQEAARKAKEAKKEGRPFFVAVEAAVKVTDEQAKKLDEIGKELAVVQRGAMRKTMAILSPEQQEKVKKAMRPQPKKGGAQAGKKKAE